MEAIHEISAIEQRDLLRSGDLAPSAIVDHYLERIERLNKDVGAFVTVTADAARAKAQRATSGPLAGLPHADKDLAVRRGVPTYFGSAAVKALVDSVGPLFDQSDPIVDLADDLGLISLGKTNTPEFGLYGYTESAIMDAARHPNDLALNAGGSSGGAAAAVASGLLPFAIGSDGGGSVRIPAATVGLVGLKPTLGAIRTDIPGTTTTGAVNGPLARDTVDAALLFEGMADAPAGSITGQLAHRLDSVRVAFAVDSPWSPHFDVQPHPFVVDALDQGLSALSDLGHQLVREVSLKDPRYGTLFLTAWQRSAAGIPDVLDPELMNPVSRWLMENGRRLGPDQLADNDADIADYRHRAPSIWEDCDVLVTPALGVPPQLVGSYSEIPEENFYQQVQYSPYTSFVNLLGLPAIVVPTAQYVWGPAGRELPFGIQIIGKPGTDALLLRLAFALEQHVSLS